MSMIFLIVLVFLGSIVADEPYPMETSDQIETILEDVITTTLYGINNRQRGVHNWVMKGATAIADGVLDLIKPKPKPRSNFLNFYRRTIYVQPTSPPIQLPNPLLGVPNVIHGVANVQNGTADLLNGAANVLHGAADMWHGKRNCQNQKGYSVLPKEIYASSKVNFFEAMEFCSRKLQRLATIQSETENERLVLYFKSKEIVHAHFWIAGWDWGHKGTLVWLSTGTLIKYNNLKEGANLTEGSCLQISSTGVWDYFNCYNEEHFICEKY